MKKFTKLFFALALAPAFFSANLYAPNVVVSNLFFEEGIHFPGDPIMMSLTVTNVGSDPTQAPGYWVDVHLTPDTPGLSATNYHIQTFSGGLAPGQSHTYEWVQRMPGHITGNFQIFAETSGSGGGNISSTTSPVIELRSDQATRFPTTTLLTRPFDSPDIEDEEFDFDVVGEVFNADGSSETPSMSADGRFVVFASTATNIATPVVQFEDEDDEEVDDEDVPLFPSGNLFDIYLQDLKEGTVTLVSNPGGAFEFSNGNSHHPKISPDGRFIVFHSTATNLVTGGNNDYSDIYVYDRLSGTLERISKGMNGALANGPSFNASISDPDPINGHRYVVFESEAVNLLDGITNNVADIFLYNLNTGAIRRVNVTDDGGQAMGGHSRSPVISADARHIAFESRATNLGSPERSSEVFVHDRDANRTVQISVGFDAAGNPFPADGDSYSPAITPDGRFVAFVSEAANLFSNPATGSVTLSGRRAETSIVFPETVPGTGLIRFTPDVNATGEIHFVGEGPPVPNQNERRTITIRDGVNPEVTFEFANTAGEGYQVADGNVRVVVGQTRTSTRNQLRNAINGSALTITATDAVSAEGNPMIHLENTDQGEAGNDQPIVTENLGGVLEVQGMGGAVVTNVEDGDELIIGTRDTGDESVFIFVDGEPQALNEVQIGNTARESRDNLLNTFRGLLELNVPDIDGPTSGGTFLTGPLAGNPEPQDIFPFEHEGVTQFFQFVPDGIVFDPAVELGPEAIPVVIGETLEETRGNLVRYLQALFDFDDLTEALGDAPATGSVRIANNPEGDDNANVTIGDGIDTANFAFVEEFAEDEDDPDFDFEQEIIDDRDPLNVLIVIGADAAETQERLLTAIQGSPLEITANAGIDEEGEEAIILVNNQMGPIGNVEIQFEPVPDDPDEEPEEPAIFVVFGMAGGMLADAPARGSVRVQINPEDDDDASVTIGDGIQNANFAFVEEFEEDDDDPGFDFEGEIIDDRDPFNVLIVIGADAVETQGRLLTAIQGSPLAITANAGIDEEGMPAIVLVNNQIGPVGNVPIVFEPVPEEPDDPDEEPGEPAIFVVFGMDGGALTDAEPGRTYVVYDHELLHFRVTFEFSDEETVAQNHVRVPLAASGAATLGNLLDTIRSIGLPRVRVAGDDLEITFSNFIRSGINTAQMTIDFTGDPNVLEEILSEGGVINTPREGARLTFDDGAMAITFEFDQDGMVTPGNIGVPIGQNAADTRDYLIRAIQESELDITAVDATGEHAAVRVVNNRGGSIPGHEFITFEEEEFPAGFVVTTIEGRNNPVPGESFTLSDGEKAVTFEFVDPDQEAGHGNIAVVLGENDQRDVTFENLVVALRDVDLKITAIPAEADGAPRVNLTNWVPGPEGNVFITTNPPDFPSFEVEGMSGGGFEGDGTPQVYLHDRDANDNGVFDETRNFTVEAISVTPLNTLGVDPALEPSISADGRFVSFRTFGFGMQPLTVERSDGQVFPNVAGPVMIIQDDEIPTDEDDPPAFNLRFIFEDSIQRFTELGTTSDIYVRDRLKGVNDRVSVNRFGETPPIQNAMLQLQSLSARNAVMSADGRYIVFTADNNGVASIGPEPPTGPRRGGAIASGMTNRHPINTVSLRNLFLHDRKFTTSTPDPEPTFPPIVNLASPSDGDQLSVGVAHELLASAIPNPQHPGATIEAVEFLVNGNIVGVVIAAPFSFEWTPDIPGTYSIVARARDSRGETASSRVSTVTVDEVDPVARDSDFVRRVYSDLLGRQPSPFELRQTVSAMESGDLSRDRLVADLMDRFEFEEILVNAYSAYWVVLGRAPTTTEMQGAVAIIRFFLDLDEDEDEPPEDPEEFPEGVIVGEVQLALGLQLLTQTLLTSAEFVSRFGAGFEFGRNREFIEHLYRNIGRSPSDLDLIRGNAIIEGTDGQFEGFGRELYTTAFIGRWFFSIVGAELFLGQVRIGIPGSLRERHRRAAMFFALTGEIPTPEKVDELASGNRRQAVRVAFSSAQYLNALGTFFGSSVLEVDRNEKDSHWLGRYNDRHFNYNTFSGWIRHEEHDWWFISSGSGSWVYDHIMGSWLWTNEDVYPWIFSDEHDTWIFYHRGGEPEQRQFFFDNLQEWQSVEN